MKQIVIVSKKDKSKDYSPGVLLGILGGGMPLVPTLFQTKKCHFLHPFSDLTSKIHTSFQTLSSGRNYFIITQIRAQAKNFFKCISNLHISIFSYSFGIETINTFIRSRSSLENYTRFQTKWAKCIPVFRPKGPKTIRLSGGTYLYGLYKGVSPGTTAKLRLQRVLLFQNNTSAGHTSLLQV